MSLMYDPLMTDVPVSVGQTLKVRLTRRGRQVFIDEHTYAMKMTADAATQSLADRTDADGFTVFQLFEMMSIFGSHTSRVCAPTGNYQLFEDDVIMFVPNDLDIGVTSLL